MATDSENHQPITDAEQTWDFDELAARAGAAVRRPAPEHGAAEVVRRGHRHRVLTTLVAGSAVLVLIAVGVALVRAGSKDSSSPVATTPLDIGRDSSIARAALISVDQLGPGWSPEFPISSLAPWREEFAAQPECAEYTAAV